MGECVDITSHPLPANNTNRSVYPRPTPIYLSPLSVNTRHRCCKVRASIISIISIISIYYIHLSFTSASTSTNLCSFSLFHHDANLDLVRKPTGQNLSDLFGKYSSLKDVSNTCGTVANKPNVPTRPKAGELLLLSGQNWAPSDCQICSTSVGIGQIGPGAIFGSIAETNILLVICSNAVEQWSCWPE